MGKTLNLKLIPVLQLEPSSYSRHKYETPRESLRVDPKGWEIYNQSSYKDAGLKNLDPIQAGGWLFEVEKLSPENLKIILSKIFEETLGDDLSLEQVLKDMYEFSPLISGGYILNINDKNISLPGCCSGLETIEDWENILEVEQLLWNGHDTNEIKVKKENENIIITIDNESYPFNITDFNEMLKGAKKVLNHFIERNAVILNELFKFENGYDLAKSMIYKHADIKD